MDALRAALEEAEAENADLKAELNAFDPKFFEEIEDLKHDHCVLSNKVGACMAAAYAKELSYKVGANHGVLWCLATRWVHGCSLPNTRGTRTHHCFMHIF